MNRLAELKITIMKTKTLFIPTFILLSIALLISGCSSSTTDANGEPDINILPEAVITLDNNGAQSYTVTSIEGEGAWAELNSQNPIITLVPGGRYTFVNESGATAHPLDFRNGNHQKLFGQSRMSDSFNDVEEINLVMEGDLITFTLTEDLASELADYVCSFHPNMRGTIEITD
ncbi:MAG: hypothetical protein EA391_08350 [Balneolaceae bacterium]|nr:MAG: hypothetical protein EA391_08350 [Balneolaceae bacterium]